jgi:hypothetical protein
MLTMEMQLNYFRGFNFFLIFFSKLSLPFNNQTYHMHYVPPSSPLSLKNFTYNVYYLKL